MLTINDIELCEDCEEYGRDCECSDADDDFDWENYWDEYGDYLYEQQKDAKNEH